MEFMLAKGRLEWFVFFAITNLFCVYIFVLAISGSSHLSTRFSTLLVPSSFCSFLPLSVPSFLFLFLPFSFCSFLPLSVPSSFPPLPFHTRFSFAFNYNSSTRFVALFLCTYLFFIYLRGGIYLATVVCFSFLFSLCDRLVD